MTVTDNDDRDDNDRDDEDDSYQQSFVPERQHGLCRFMYIVAV